MSATLVELREASGIHRLVLSRTDKRNAISKQMYDAAAGHIGTLQEQGVAIAVLSSAGPVFCAGADLAELGSGFNAPVELAELLLRSRIFWIAEVGGGVLGAGVALVSACHAALGTADAWFSLPELNHGFYPEPVIAWTAGRGVSRRWLHGLAVTGRRASAAEAVANGLLSAVAEDGRPLDEEIKRIADRISAAEASRDRLVASWRLPQGAPAEGDRRSEGNGDTADR